MQTWLHQFFSTLRGPGFQVTFPDGSSHRYGDGRPSFHLILGPGLSIPTFFFSPELAFGEAYTDGKLLVEGDLDAMLHVFYANDAKMDRLKRPWNWLCLNLPTASNRQRRQVGHHYDVGNEFYRLWLDPTLTYSCAYFRSPADTLHQAQLQKIDHTLGKLNLKPGERLLDIGCGWGEMIIAAARQYGVRALGITLSSEQQAACQERIAAAGLHGQVEVRLQHYADLSQAGVRFDKVVSVGMFEHVGRAQIRRFMKALHSLTKEGGLALLHTITRRIEAPVSAWISRYIFPGGYIPSWREVVAGLAERNMLLLDAENLRPHYARTLDCWKAGFTAAEAQVRAMYDERFVRMWRLYLHGAAAAFRYGDLHLHQFLFSSGPAVEYPLTREYMYHAGMTDHALPRERRRASWVSE